MKEINIKIYLDEKEKALLEEYVRRFNLYNEEVGDPVKIDEEKAVSALIIMALRENPAKKYYPNYKESGDNK